MEDTNILDRTYHHVAFKISDSHIDSYLDKIKTLNLELKPPRKRVYEYGILKSEYMFRGHYLYNNGHALLYATMSC